MLGKEAVARELSAVRGGAIEDLLGFLHAHEPQLGPNNYVVVEVAPFLLSWRFCQYKSESQHIPRWRIDWVTDSLTLPSGDHILL